MISRVATFDSITAAPAARNRFSLPQISRLERRYYLALLSMAVIDLAMSALFLALSGKIWVIALRIPEVLAFLGLLTLTGGYVLFAPIRHLLHTGEGLDTACDGRPGWRG